jgi:hypothetical protein
MWVIFNVLNIMQQPKRNFSRIAMDQLNGKHRDANNSERNHCQKTLNTSTVCSE